MEKEMTCAEAIRTEEGRREHAGKIYEAAMNIGKLTGLLGEYGNEPDGILAQTLGTAMSLVSGVAAMIDPGYVPDGDRSKEEEFLSVLFRSQSELFTQKTAFRGLVKEETEKQEKCEIDREYFGATPRELEYAAGMMDEANLNMQEVSGILEDTGCGALQDVRDLVAYAEIVPYAATAVLRAAAGGECPEGTLNTYRLLLVFALTEALGKAKEIWERAEKK